MNNDIVSRIQEVMSLNKLNSLSLSKKLGYSSSEKLSRLFRDKKAKPSYDIIYDIANMFEINIDWLITGRGTMQKEISDKLEDKLSPTENKLFDLLNEKDRKIEKLLEEIGKLKAQNEVLEQTIEKIKDSEDVKADIADVTNVTCAPITAD